MPPLRTSNTSAFESFAPPTPDFSVIATSKT
jgi:hypothetical protein